MRVNKAGLSLTGSVVRGPSAQPFLALPAIPQNVARIRVVSWDNSFNTPIPWTDLYPSNFVNGITPLPASQFQNYLDWYLVQAVATNGDFGGTIPIYRQYIAEENDGWESLAATNFINAAAHMKENLKFLLRSATLNQPFSYSSGLRVHEEFTTPNPDDSELPYPEWWYARPGTATNYEYYGYHMFSSNLNYSIMQELRPVVENHLWRNFVYDLADYGEFGGTNGSFFWTFTPAMRALGYPMNHRFTGSAAGPFPLAFSTTNAVYLLSGWLPDPSSWSEWEYDEALEQGLAVNTSSGFAAYLPSGRRNLFGLPIGALLSDNDSSHSPDLFPAGGSPIQTRQSFAFLNCSDPGFQIVDYYFASQTPYFHFYTNALDYSAQYPAPPVPGSPTFSVTNTLPLRITGLGQPITVAGWAKMAITNGYPGKYAYLEQYWDKAYIIGTNGLVTTNQTGLLSPYGEFFPTDPGPVALVTMPDVDTGQRGASLVHVIKLQLDVNHDGGMDLTFGGPDNTSQDRPFVFWVNNDFDRVHKVGNDDVEDDVASTDRKANSPYDFKPAPDCEYRDSLGHRVLPSVRDVEDFARLWIAGVNTNLFASLPANVTAELSWGDKGNPNPNNPTIDIFGTADTFGQPGSGSGIGYLTNYLTAWNQSSNSYTGLRLRPGDSIPVVFSNSFGYQGWNHAIWCGVTRGTGVLTLTFTQGTNKIAETSAYIEIKDIKEMYERWTVGDVATMAPKTRPYLPSDGLPTGTPPFRYAPPGDSNTPYILLVHDYNLPPWKKDRWAETAFKRLYWQGYLGRFGLFRWPVYDKDARRALDNSESNAWASATGLLNLLTNLNAQYSTNVYLIAHGYGAVAAGEALRLAGINQIVNRYIAMQGAVPSHAYDPSAPVRLLAPGTDSSTPNRYALYNGSACYFAGGGGAGIYINYFNTNDVVSTNRWCSDQDAKCDTFSGYRWDGANFYRGYLPGLLLLFPQDRYEIFSYADEARCQAIGAQPNLGGPFFAQPNVDLAASFFFKNKEEDHSAQFVDNCPNLWEFWDQVLRSLGLKK